MEIFRSFYLNTIFTPLKSFIEIYFWNWCGLHRGLHIYVMVLISKWVFNNVLTFIMRMLNDLYISMHVCILYIFTVLIKYLSNFRNFLFFFTLLRYAWFKYFRYLLYFRNMPLGSLIARKIFECVCLMRVVYIVFWGVL